MRLEGGAEIEKYLKTIEPNVGKKIIRQALRPAAKELASEVKAEAPRDSGSLQTNIRVRKNKTPKGRFAMRVATIAKTDDSTPGFPVETGHQAGSTIVPENPFARRAFDRKVSGLASAIIEALWRGIREL